MSPLQHPQEIYEFLHGIDAGAVLDIATGAGQFADVLADCLASYKEIIGVDTHARAIELAAERVKHPNISFRVADAAALPFLSDRFDTVTISNSLHHMAELPSVLEEMRRVTVPEGRWIVFEMHTDALTEASRNAIDLHLWAATADRAMGKFHAPVYSHDELMESIHALELADLRTIEWHSQEDAQAEQIEGVLQVIENVRAQTVETEAGPSLSAAADELIHRIRSHGMHSQPFVLATGRLSKRET